VSRTQPTRRPILFILVFGAFLALLGITATAQAVMVSAQLSASSLDAVVGSDAATVRAFLNAYVDPHLLDPTSAPTPDAADRLNGQLATLVRPGEVLRVELFRPDGVLIGTSATDGHGGPNPSDAAFAGAVAGTPSAVVVSTDGTAAADLAGETPTMLQEYFPVSTGGQVKAIVGVWRDATPLLDALASVRRDVVAITLTAGVVAAILLFLVFRAAQGRLTRQAAALVDATRHDPLSGLLNHGALVDLLTRRVEGARTLEEPLGIALLDIDNFRLLNDNHGHEAGDEALLTVVELIRRSADPTITFGRYGPDEFLLIAPADSVERLAPMIDALRVALADRSLQFEATERLPITFSAGIALYPDHGTSATVLLAIAAQTLEEAKASGGDATRVAGHLGEADASVARFDVLHGLVMAVDAKDRYTKRHSEDVARYSTFLADRLGLEDELVRSVWQAGLLHDIGKVGIPDQILRKPGPLTRQEYEVVKQHVALGSMIVRDIPEFDLVQAGIRHHHERWDGEGYLGRLVGEEIPLIARILAVGDAFSAMTTTRPYRKALDVREALTRLGDAAGSQLDERLVVAFVDGIETADDPPLPDSAVSRTTLWTPGKRVA
jgi:diguanylate cyclase (GGDEF)-like protein/putative nucleotidyltransferase with HDIG domain